MSPNMRDHAATVLSHQQKLAEGKPDGEAATVTTEATEADALAKLAEDQADQSQTDDEAVVGVTYQSALTMKNFVPAGDPAWLPREMAGQPRGAKHVMLGRIRGTVNRTVARETPWEGKILQSIELQGGFQALVTASGQLLSAASLFLSRAFAVQIETSLAEARRDDPHATIAIDVDVGVESTGKTIAYTWTVTHYLNGQAMRALRALRQPRKLIPNGGGAPQLEHSPPAGTAD
jgi:hypothetical protein